MDGLNLAVWVFLGALTAAVLWAVVTHDKLVRLRNRVDAVWADIEVQLERRHDLVPNLVETVDAYAVHERGTLDEVQAYNLSVQAYNNAVQFVPTNLVAWIASFHAREFLSAPASEREVSAAEFDLPPIPAQR